MQALIATLITSLVPLVKMVLKALGIGVVSYVGINFILSQITDVIINNALSLPVAVQQILGLMKFDVAVNIILSAVTTRLTLRGIDKATDTKSKLAGV
jgi:ABC-type dipeptide/oligopeptide/nickel transport system permease component